MLSIFNDNLKGLIVGLLLAINDVFSFGITKEVFLKERLKSIYYLIIPTILYSLQIWLFYFGLSRTPMAVLNLTWNLFSNILVTIMGLFYFGEKITNLKTIALLFAFVSIILFGIDGLNE